MNRSLHDYMQVGIVHFMAFPHIQTDDDYLDTMAKIVEDEFFDAIEVKAAKNAPTQQKAKALLESSGMAVSLSAHPVLIENNADLNTSDEIERKRAVELVKRAVEHAYQLGAQSLSLFSGMNPGPHGLEQAIGNLIESLREICAYARSLGDLDVYLELFDHTVDFRRLIGPARLAVEVAQEVRKVDPSFGLLVDLSHLPLLGEAPENVLRTTRDYLKHVHLGNCVVQNPQHPLYGDKHPRFGYPGSEIDVPELTAFLRLLFEVGYLAEGTIRGVAFEIKPVPGESSAAVIAQAKRKLRTAWLHV